MPQESLSSLCHTPARSSVQPGFEGVSSIGFRIVPQRARVTCGAGQQSLCAQQVGAVCAFPYLLWLPTLLALRTSDAAQLSAIYAHFFCVLASCGLLSGVATRNHTGWRNMIRAF